MEAGKGGGGKERRGEIGGGRRGRRGWREGEWGNKEERGRG